jgi:CheY-like chemotaxis protein
MPPNASKTLFPHPANDLAQARRAGFEQLVSKPITLEIIEKLTTATKYLLLVKSVQ